MVVEGERIQFLPDLAETVDNAVAQAAQLTNSIPSLNVPWAARRNSSASISSAALKFLMFDSAAAADDDFVYRINAHRAHLTAATR